MEKILQRHIIKIPKHIILYYCKLKQFIIIEGKYGKKSFKLPTKINLIKQKNTIQVTKNSYDQISNNLKKKLKSLQGLTAALLKQAILEVSKITCKKLKLVGLGYKIFNLNDKINNIIYFKLGYSHFIYFKIPKNIKIINIKSIKLFIIGNSCKIINNIAAVIKSYKTPEPYKGKGILYVNEKIILKEGKKLN